MGWWDVGWIGWMERCTIRTYRDLVPHASSCNLSICVSVSSKTSTAATTTCNHGVTENATKHKMCFDSCQVSTAAAAAAPAPAPPMPVPADCGALVVWTSVALAKCGGVSGRGALLGQHPHLRHQLDDCLFAHRPLCTVECIDNNAASYSFQLTTLTTPSTSTIISQLLATYFYPSPKQVNRQDASVNQGRRGQQGCRRLR